MGREAPGGERADAAVDGAPAQRQAGDPAGVDATGSGRRIAVGAVGLGAIASLAGCSDGIEVDGAPEDGADDGGRGDDGDDRADDAAATNRELGRAARARHPGAVVIGDSSAAWAVSKGPDEVRSQSPVYAPSFNTVSTRTAKTDLGDVDPDVVLEDIASMPIYSWRFADDPDARHVGPTAEAFHERFGFDRDDAAAIATVDADGVVLAAIDALADRIDDAGDGFAADVDALDDRVDDVEARLDALATAVGAADDTA